MVILIRISYLDDSYGSKNVGVIPCESILSAKNTISEKLERQFGEFKDNSLEGIAAELNDSIDCDWDEDSLTFWWMDNGHGDEFIIKEFNETEYNKFQY